MRGDIRREFLVRWIGQVIAEGQPDPGVGAADTEHHQAVAGVEPEKVGHDGEDAVGRADANTAAQAGRLGVNGVWVTCL